MIIVRRAFDRSSIAELPEDDASSLERKLVAAMQRHADRNRWLPPHERMGILRRFGVAAVAQRTPVEIHPLAGGFRRDRDRRSQSGRILSRPIQGSLQAS